MQTGGDVRPQYFGHGGQVQSANAGTRYQLHHGNHAVQLRLVHGDAGVDGILTCTVQYSTVQYSTDRCTDRGFTNNIIIWSL